MNFPQVVVVVVVIIWNCASKKEKSQQEGEKVIIHSVIRKQVLKVCVRGKECNQGQGQ